MTKTVFVFIVGVSLGATSLLVLQRAQQPGVGQVVVTPAPVPMECQQQLSHERDRAAELERQLAQSSRARVQVVETASVSSGVAPQVEREDSSSEPEPEVDRWRISAIEKFVPLSEEQKRRLEEKYQIERENKVNDSDTETESLESILGEENAKYYREQVQAAFDRVQKQEAEKEVAWLSRQLNLNQEQERSVQGVFAEVEQTVDREFSEQQHGVARSPQERVRQMIAENRRRSQLLLERLQGILRPDQYQAYARIQADSSESDVEVFHDPGQHQ